MPPVRIRERARAKKGTLKRLLKMLFKLYPGELILSLFCLLFNVFGNLSSSIFVSLCTSTLTKAGELNKNPFTDTFEVSSTIIRHTGRSGNRRRR